MLNLSWENVNKVNDISVKLVSPGNFNVIVQSISRTEHHVTANNDFLDQFSKYDVTPEKIIKSSFKFLLDREPNTSILNNFNITIISKYFPEYPDIINAYF